MWGTSSCSEHPSRDHPELRSPCQQRPPAETPSRDPPSRDPPQAEIPRQRPPDRDPPVETPQPHHTPVGTAGPHLPTPPPCRRGPASLQHSHREHPGSGEAGGGVFQNEKRECGAPKPLFRVEAWPGFLCSLPVPGPGLTLPHPLHSRLLSLRVTGGAHQVLESLCRNLASKQPHSLCPGSPGWGGTCRKVGPELLQGTSPAGSPRSRCPRQRHPRSRLGTVWNSFWKLFYFYIILNL